MGYYELGIFFLGFVSAYIIMHSARAIAIGTTIFLICMMLLAKFGIITL